MKQIGGDIMCLELTKEELQAGIIQLEKNLHIMQINYDIHGYMDSTLPDAATLLAKMRKELGVVCEKWNRD